LFFVGEKCLDRVTAWLSNKEKKENDENKDIFEKSFTKATENFIKAATSVEMIVPKYNAILQKDVTYQSISTGRLTSRGELISWWQERRNFGNFYLKILLAD
jgi:hypothetical protein